MSESISPDQSSAPTRRKPFQLVRLTNWQIILIALIIVGGRLIFDFSQRIVEGQQKIGEQRALEAEIEALQQERRELEAARAYYSSTAYIEVWAHSKGKIVREGEVLVVPIYLDDEDVTSIPPPAPSMEPPLPPWRVWWTLFFDSSPPFSQ